MSVYTSQQTVTTDTTTRVHTVHDDLFAVRVETTATVVSAAGSLVLPPPPFEQATEFLVDRVNLDALIAGGPVAHSSLAVYPASFRENLRLNGWNPGSAGFRPVSTPYTALVAGSTTVDDIMDLDIGSHMAFDAHGRALPVALMFDYVNGDVRERSFDLPKLAEHLLTRPDVIVYARKDVLARSNTGARATTVTEAIDDIPYYNAGPGSNRTITFRWTPDTETYRKVWDYCRTRYDRFPSNKLRDGAFELDVLGIVAAGCVVTETDAEED